MNEEDFDKEIKKAICKKIDKPQGYSNMIKNALDNEEKNSYFKQINILKKVACFLLIIVFATFIIFAKDISAYINYLLKSNSDNGVQEAIDNGYIQDVNMKYIDSNGVKVKVTELLMDDYNLSMLFYIEIPEIENIEEIYDVNFSNLIITDDKDNIIVAEFENTDKYHEFCKERNMEISYNNIAYSNGAFEGKIVSKFDKDIEYMYKTYSDNFPKSKKLIINFDKIILSNKNSNEKTAIEGTWNLKVNLPETMYNRKTILYSAKNCTKDDIIVTKAEVSNTAMKIELVTRWGEPVYTEKDSEEEKNRKIEEFFNNTHSVRNILIKNEYVENSKGERFYPVINGSDGNGGYNQMFSGMLRHWQTFNLTKYGATDTLKVVFELKGEEIIIELES